jgi:Mn2+/Fe2+ NRAMP family transporter
MSLTNRLAQFGPGLLYAGAAVGVSHLVQSTRAGAEFGLQLVGVILLVNVIKYPIFESGPRYAAATGKTLLDGYKQIGQWAVWTYALMSVLTMCIVMGAITIVTAGLFAQLTGLTMPAEFLALGLLLLSVLILGWGHYSTLDRVMKFIVILLTITTILALAFSWLEPVSRSADWMTTFDWSNRNHILFLVALIGWMPAPIDISIWHSVWSVSKNKEQGRRIPMREALNDFKVGYWGTTFLAVCFVGLGAIIMFGTEESPASGSVAFAEQLIRMYTSNLGQWAFPFIALAAFTTMFSTLLTCLDAFPRTLRKSTKLLLPTWDQRWTHTGIYWFWLILTALGTGVLLLFYVQDMRAMVDLATTISFVLAPVFAILNYIALTDRAVPMEAQPSSIMKRFYRISIGLLVLFSTWYLFY